MFGELDNEILVTLKDSSIAAQELNSFVFEKHDVFLTHDVDAVYMPIEFEGAISVLWENVQAPNENGFFWFKILKLILFINYVILNRNTPLRCKEQRLVYL